MALPQAPTFKPSSFRPTQNVYNPSREVTGSPGWGAALAGGGCPGLATLPNQPADKPSDTKTREQLVPGHCKAPGSPGPEQTGALWREHVPAGARLSRLAAPRGLGISPMCRHKSGAQPGTDRSGMAGKAQGVLGLEGECLLPLRHRQKAMRSRPPHGATPCSSAPIRPRGLFCGHPSVRASSECDTGDWARRTQGWPRPRQL